MALPEVFLPVPAQRFRLKYGVMECVECGYAKDFCTCAKQIKAAVTTAQDGAAADSIERRIKECMGR
jgi:hypothetical protein